MMATSQNQTNNIGALLTSQGLRTPDIPLVLNFNYQLTNLPNYQIPWPVIDLPVHEKEKQNCQHRIEPHEAEQSKQSIARANVFGIALRGAHEVVDQPWLAADLRRHPSRRVGNVREGQAEHQDPEHPVRRK